MPEITNAALLLANALLYFAVLSALFRCRHHIGLGAFFCALGVMHFIETYLASNLYVALPFGIVAWPGSVVLFSGKLVLLLLVYIREDAAVVRQPIYGLLIGNVLTLMLAMLLAQHVPVAIAPGEAPNLSLVDQMGVLMVWGTALLFVDCILIILLYERTRHWLGDRVPLRIFLSTAVILSFDQLGFFAALRFLYGAEFSVMVGGWLMKMAAAALYAVMAGLYLRFVERTESRSVSRARVGDVFGVLTYRERYEALLERSGRDALTGARGRGQLETEGPRLVRRAIDAESDLTLFVIDIDHFKALNDRHGHAAGDAVLREIAARITRAVRSSDLVFRYGGEEFVVLCVGLGGGAAAVLGEHLRQTVARADGGHPVTASVGFALCPAEATDYDSLFRLADRRMYLAKASGRDRVVGVPGQPSEPVSAAQAPSLAPSAS
jgi:diguanylate cyclase (GGDEF)-like protein